MGKNDVPGIEGAAQKIGFRVVEKGQIMQPVGAELDGDIIGG